MKKLTFLFAMVFAVSMAMAQSNESTINVSGSSNSADVEQVGEDNINLLNQSSNNVFELTQTGDDNYSDLRQAATGENTAYVNQLGDRNRLTRAGRALQGSGNLLDLNQTGDDNITRLYQDSRNQFAYIDQVGNSNEVQVNQDSKGNIADIDQNGNGNFTNILQDNGLSANTAVSNVSGYGNGNETTGDKWLDIKQLGSSNWASTTITGDENDADIHQTGDDNYAKYNVTGSFNTMNATQNGFDNDVIIDQDWVALMNNSNKIAVNQTNNSSGAAGNRAYLRMTGSDNDVNFTQNGSWNQIGGKTMFPDLVPGSVATSDMLNYKGDGSTIDIVQSGNQNLVKSEMNNDNGDIDITQSGNVNITELLINAGGMGFGNDADISQLSNFNTSTNNVVGNDNSIVVVQN